MTLPTMRPTGLPEQKLMECQHCGMVMGATFLMQVAHSNHCPPNDPAAEVNAGRGSISTPSPRGADDAPDEAKGERASHSQASSPASAAPRCEECGRPATYMGEGGIYLCNDPHRLPYYRFFRALTRWRVPGPVYYWLLDRLTDNNGWRPLYYRGRERS